MMTFGQAGGWGQQVNFFIASACVLSLGVWATLLILNVAVGEPPIPNALIYMDYLEIP